MSTEIRLLTADEIDVRVAQTTNYGGVVKVNLLLYKDARVDMRILDELYGPFGWTRTHEEIGGRLYCTVSVKDPLTGQWVSKQDVGTESNTEPEKGQASDSFKRAGFNWGIGRELYTAPKIQVTLNKDEYRDNSGRIQVWASFYVKEIGYDDARNINRLVIADRNGITRFELGAKRAQARKKAEPAAQPKPSDAVQNPEYWKIVQAHAEGRKTKSGGSIRDAWIAMYHPSPEDVSKFDLDVQDVRAALSGDGQLFTK